MRKKILVIFLCFVMLLINLACQETPENEPIVNKSSEINFSALETSDDQLAHIPDHYKGEYETGYPNLHIYFNAEIKLPAGAKCSVDQITKLQLTDPMIDQLMQSFARGRDIYFEPDAKTQKQLVQELLYYQNIILKSEDVDSTNAINEVIQEIQDKLKNAPGSVELKRYSPEDAPVGTEFSCICFILDMPDDFTTSVMFITREGNSFYYYFRNDMVLQTESMVEEGNAIPNEPRGTTLPAPTIASDEAVSIGNRFLGSVGIYDLVCVTKERARVLLNHDDTVKYGWNLVYLRESGGLPVVDMGLTYSYNREQLPAYAAPWENERLELFVDEDEVEGFVWSGAGQKEKTLAQNVKILSFEDVLSCIGRNIKYKSLWPGEDKQSTKSNITIDNIVLGSCMIGVKNESNKGFMIPSWYAHYTDVELGPDFEGWIVISAIDGSYIEPMMSADTLANLQ